jgi:hypothetical protein
MFRHPKYYKELRKRNKSDQAISEATGTPTRQSVRPDPGLKQQAIEETVPHNDIEEATSSQAASDKPQAPSDLKNKPQASSDKQQASSSKPQASSSKI